MANHTDGPWRVEEDERCINVIDAHGGMIADCDWARNEDDESSIANARLIAAAPDLKDTALNLVSYVRSLGHPDDPTVRALLEMGDAAIAKARGAATIGNAAKKPITVNVESTDGRTHITTNSQVPAVSQGTTQSPTRLVPLSQESARLFSVEGWEVHT